MPPDETVDLDDLAADADMFTRLAATLDTPDIDSTVSKSIILQLAGSPQTERVDSQKGEMGISIALTSDATVNIEPYLSTVSEFAPMRTAYLQPSDIVCEDTQVAHPRNSTQPKSGLSKLTVVEGLSSASDVALPLAAKLGATVPQQDLSGSGIDFSATATIISSHPIRRTFDSLEPVNHQISLPAELLTAVDLPLLNRQGQVRSIDSPSLPVGAETAREFLAYAREHQPTLTPDCLADIDRFIEENWPAFGDPSRIHLPQPSAVKQTLRKLTLSHARLRLAESTTKQDCDRAASLLETVYETHEILGTGQQTTAPDSLPFGNDLSHEERQRLNRVREIIKLVAETNETGAPIPEIVNRAEEKGIENETLEDAVTALKIRGEVYETKRGFLEVT